MGTKKIKILILTVFIFFPNITKATDFVNLDIKIVKVHNDKIECNFRYFFDINKNDSIQMFLCCLPFTQNQRINTAIKTFNNAGLFVTYGFNSFGKGLININSFGNSANIELEFTNVELPIKPSMSDEDGLTITLDFSNNFLPEIGNLIKSLSMTEIQVSNTILINSDPKFKQIEKKTYQLAPFETLENVYLVIPKPKESFIGLFFMLIFIAILLGLFAVPKKLTQGKIRSILGLIVGLIILSYLTYLVFSKIVPEDFAKDVSMISLIGGGIGVFLGIVFRSAYNLIEINTIERQQK